jgi:hypothetical protein
MKFAPTELTRIKALIERYGYSAATELILELAQPCIRLVLTEVGGGLGARRRMSLGASRMGGTPDLPPSIRWPTNEAGYLGFLMQISLDDLPSLPGSPLPPSGQLYVFDADQTQPFAQSFSVLYSDAPKSALKPTLRPTKLPCAAELSLYEIGESFAIEGVVAADLPFRDRARLAPYQRVARAMDVDELAPGVLENFEAFSQRLADPLYDQRIAQGFPYHHWESGRLLGAFGQHHCDELQLAVSKIDTTITWRPLLNIESNVLVDYSSPADSAPVFLCYPDRGERPWSHFEAGRATIGF